MEVGYSIIYNTYSQEVVHLLAIFLIRWLGGGGVNKKENKEKETR